MAPLVGYAGSRSTGDPSLASVEEGGGGWGVGVFVARWCRVHRKRGLFLKVVWTIHVETTIMTT
jgi:hypothetical protein